VDEHPQEEDKEDEEGCDLEGQGATHSPPDVD